MKRTLAPHPFCHGGAFAAVLALASLSPAKAAPSLPAVLAQAGSPGSASDSAASSTLREGEATFLVEATQSGRTAAEVSRLAVSQASATSVRGFAQQLVADYAQINGSLEALARRKSLSLPLAPTSFSDPYRELAAQSGSAFDRAFIRRATAVCQRELQLCESAVADAKDADVRELVGSLLPVLRDHVNKTKELEKSL